MLEEPLSGGLLGSQHPTLCAPTSPPDPTQKCRSKSVQEEPQGPRLGIRRASAVYKVSQDAGSLGGKNRVQKRPGFRVFLVVPGVGIRLASLNGRGGMDTCVCMTEPLLST